MTLPWCRVCHRVTKHNAASAVSEYAGLQLSWLRELHSDSEDWGAGRLFLLMRASNLIWTPQEVVIFCYETIMTQQPRYLQTLSPSLVFRAKTVHTTTYHCLHSLGKCPSTAKTNVCLPTISSRNSCPDTTHHNVFLTLLDTEDEGTVWHSP